MKMRLQHPIDPENLRKMSVLTDTNIATNATQVVICRVHEEYGLT
jgi:hypothetical protein